MLSTWKGYLHRERTAQDSNLAEKVDIHGRTMMTAAWLVFYLVLFLGLALSCKSQILPVDLHFTFELEERLMLIF